MKTAFNADCQPLQGLERWPSAESMGPGVPSAHILGSSLTPVTTAPASPRMNWPLPVSVAVPPAPSPEAHMHTHKQRKLKCYLSS